MSKKKKKKKNNEPRYIRDGIYELNEVLDHIGQHEKDYNGHMVKMWSQRYRVFKYKGVKCVECGLEGSFFALEKSRYQEHDRHHFNLYALNENGEEVLMTKDHIMPKAKGGRDRFENYQTMCCHCNEKKSDKVLT